MKQIYFLLFTCFFTNLLSSQDLNLQWANGMGSTLPDYGMSITTDGLGNVYVTGFYYSTIDLDPGAGEQIITSNGDQDLFIQKFDSSGNLIWAKSIGGTSSEQPNSIIYDGSGNLYITGLFSETVDFDPGSGTTNLVANGLQDIFVAKFNTDGDLIWVNAMGGTDRESGQIVTLDSSGNLLVTGYFSETVDFDPGVGINNFTSNGGKDVFIQKLDSDGNLIWTKVIGGSSDDTGYSLVSDVSNNIYITGDFSDSVDFDPGVGNEILTSAGNRDIFVQKLDSNGNYIWAKSMGGSGFESGKSINIDSTNDIFVFGYFNDTVDFDPGSGTTNLTSNGSSDIFIQKLDSSGSLIWTKSIGGTSNDYVEFTHIDTSDNLYLIGYFYGTVDFDPGSGTSNISSKGSMDIFIEKIDNSGNLLWAKTIGGTNIDRGYSLASDDNNIYVTGGFQRTVDFDPETSVTNLTSNNNSTDIFAIKLMLDTALNVEDNQLFSSIKIFPNPTKSEAIITSKNLNNFSIKVFNSLGQLILEENGIIKDRYTIDLNNTSGIYFVEISTEGAKKTFKLLKQ